MTPKTKALVYNLICFAIIFIFIRIVLQWYSSLSGIWLPLTTFVISTILAPKFQAVRTQEGEKVFMKWLFIKGIRQL